MFHWICPECGREIPPSVKECPACDPKAVPAAELIQAAPVVESVQTAPVIEAPAAPPPKTPAPVELPIAAAAAEPEPEAEPLDPMLAIAEQIRAVQLEGPAEATSEAQPEPQGELESSRLAPLVAAVGAPVPEPAVEAEAEPVTPPRWHPVRLLAIEGRFQPIALLAAPEVAAPTAIVEERAAESSVPEKAPEPPPVEEPVGSRLPLAPLQNYAQAASRAMKPAAPRSKILRPDSGPRITLPGPTLPPQLTSFGEAAITPLREPRRRPQPRRVPGWLVIFIVMLVLLVSGGMVVFYLLPLPRSNAETNTPAPAAAAPAPAPAPTSHPLARSIEVTGFRFVIDSAKQSVIHYLLVNHSPAGLSGITVFVTLRSASARPGEAPLCRFSFRAPGLGPFESKEMTSPIEKLTRPVALPDWQDIRAEVETAE